MVEARPPWGRACPPPWSGGRVGGGRRGAVRWSQSGSVVGAGPLSCRFGDARVRRARRARVESPVFSAEHAGEAVGYVRPAVVATWHLLDRHPPLPVPSLTQPTTKYSSSPLASFTNRPSCTPISADISLPRLVSGRACENRRFHRVTNPHIGAVPTPVAIPVVFTRVRVTRRDPASESPPVRTRRGAGRVGIQAGRSIHGLPTRNTGRRAPDRRIWEILLRVILNVRLHGETNRESCREGVPG